MCGHVDRCASADGVLGSPQAGDRLKGHCQQVLLSEDWEPTHLVLGVEVETALAVEANVAEHTGLVATPGEHGQRHRDGHIDTKLANVHLALEFTSSSSGLREDRRAVAVAVLVDDVQSIIESLRL